jgi:hypothetical protein
MTHAQQMLQAHPRKPRSDMDVITQCIEACFDCAQTCYTCADACLGEHDVQALVRCIRLDLDCADICDATGRMLSRMTEPDAAILRAQLQACITACRACGDECERHAGHHEHCRICAEACRRCEQACNELLRTFQTAQSQAA